MIVTASPDMRKIISLLTNKVTTKGSNYIKPSGMKTTSGWGSVVLNMLDQQSRDGLITSCAN